MQIYSYGHWEVAGKKYTNKLEAFDAAFSIGHHPHWNFYEEEFSKYDWTIEPTDSITDLYCQRARAIRQSHDYVMIWFSGGCDSWTIVDSFVRSGLLVDEIWSVSPYGWCAAENDDRSSTNIANETRLATIPEAKKFLARDPRIKFKVIDSSNLIEDFWSKNTIDPLRNQWFTPEVGLRENSERLYDSHVPTGSGNRIVKIQGVDKPRIVYRDGMFYMVFLDILAMSRISQKRTLLTDINDYDMAFYWHPESVKILIKQGHLVKNYFKKHPEQIDLLSPTRDGNRMRIYQRLLNKIIYPEYDFNIWQADKDYSRMFDNNVYYGFCKHDRSSATDNWRSVINTYSDAVYQLYERHNSLDNTAGEIQKINGWYYNLPGCFSRMYCLGN